MATIVGSPGNDKLDGTNLRDTIFGARGNDIINGLGGNDNLLGGVGNDLLNGGLDDDHLVGGIGADKINGGDGNDNLDSAHGFRLFVDDEVTDVLNGGNGNDHGGINLNDTFIGGPGTDDVFLNFFISTPTATNLNFSNIGNAQPTAIGAAGTPFANTMIGTTESITVFVSNALPGSSILGSPGSDSFSMTTPFSDPSTQGIKIFGGAGDDSLNGSGKNDQLIGGPGSDIIDGGFGGKDTLAGGANEDFFLFRLFSDPPTPGVISDFNPAEDLMIVGLQSGNALDFGDETKLLLKTANPVNGTTPAGIAQFIYETDTGKLFIDTNGSTLGGLQLFETLTGKPNISAGDIYIESST